MAPIGQKPSTPLGNTIKYFLMAATPILFLLYLKPEMDLPEIPLQVLVGNAIWVLLLLLVGWKYYWEIWKPKQKRRKKKEAQEAQEAQEVEEGEEERPVNKKYT